MKNMVLPTVACHPTLCDLKQGCEWVCEWVSQWVSESVSQWVSESVSQWVSSNSFGLCLDYVEDENITRIFVNTFPNQEVCAYVCVCVCVCMRVCVSCGSDMTWYGMVCVFTGVFLAECSRGLLLLRGELRGPQHTYTHTYTHTRICGCMDRLTPYVEWQTHCGHALVRSSKDCRTINDVFVLYSKGTMLYVRLLFNECECVCECVCVYVRWYPHVAQSSLLYWGKSLKWRLTMLYTIHYTSLL
jgi:hypothetical protein